MNIYIYMKLTRCAYIIYGLKNPKRYKSVCTFNVSLVNPLRVVVVITRGGFRHEQEHAPDSRPDA